MAKDKVKVTAIVLAIVFFFLWILGTTLNGSDYDLLQQKYDTLSNQYNDLSDVANSSINLVGSVCQSQLQNLDSQWRLAYNTLENCYVQGTAECNPLTPTLNLTK